jgi:small conductance mechanosensitive channel
MARRKTTKNSGANPGGPVAIEHEQRYQCVDGLGPATGRIPTLARQSRQGWKHMNETTQQAADAVAAAPEYIGQITQTLVTFASTYGLKVIGAILILIIGRIIAGQIRKGVHKVGDVRQWDPSLVGFMSSLAYFFVMAFVIVAVLGSFGVQTASIVAVLGAASFAVGLALQGSLSNFAAGVMILLFRPFKVGDYVDVAGVAGSVKSIAIFSTTMATPDNVRIEIPNSKIYGDIIKNFGGYDTRRVDMTVGIGYGDDMARAVEVIKGVIAADSRVLAEPAPLVAVAELGDSSVNLVVRPWVNAADYWAVKFDLTQGIKNALDANGIEIPFPQRVVTMIQAPQEKKQEA